MSKTVILPVRIDSYGGDVSGVELFLSEQSEPVKSMWIAVHIEDGKVLQDLTDYGYKSRKELLETYKNEKIIGLKKDRKDAELEEARDIAEDALEVLLTEDDVLLHIEGELNLPDGAIKKAYKTLQKARTGRAKKTRIDKDEVFYSLCVEDILWQAKEMKIPRKKLTGEIIKEIKDRIGDKMGSVNDTIMEAISEVIREEEQ